MYGGVHDPGMRAYRPRTGLAFFSSASQEAIGRWGEGQHTVRRDSDPGDHLGGPRLSGVVGRQSDFQTRHRSLSYQGAAGLKGFPMEQLSRRAPQPEPQPPSDENSAIGVSTPCGAVSTW